MSDPTISSILSAENFIASYISQLSCLVSILFWDVSHLSRCSRPLSTNDSDPIPDSMLTASVTRYASPLPRTLARNLTLHSDNILVTNASQNTTSLRCIVLILLPTGGLGCQSWGSQALRLHTKQWCRRKSVPHCYRANKEEENNKGVFLYGIAKIISIKMY